MRPRAAAGVGGLVRVVGARGGAGTSTFAALVARCVATGRPAALVDLGVLGGGVEVLLGIEDAPGARWADLAAVQGELDPTDLDGVLPRWGDVEVLGPDRRGAPEAFDALAPVLDALLRGGRSVVVDAPAAVLPDPRVGAACTRPQGRAFDVLVTTQDLPGVAAGLAVAPLVAPDAALVLRARRSSRVAPVEAAHVLGMSALGVLGDERGLAGAVERGLGPVVRRRGQVARLARRVADGLDGTPRRRT